ncbi:hypothetical protein [Chakrabartyella piscis]|uniref:hypothetical protein n=1 Tax=Chakrabartyella piscis TaxID=2918914 RepID=UPI0029584EE0|nr:hypothetical protein [Chakrabartyella piscis]
MKQKLSYIVIAILCALQFSSFQLIEDLAGEIQSVRNEINDVEQTLNNNINNIYTDVDAKLAEKASIIHDVDVIFGAFDSDTLIIPITFVVQPKQVTDDMMVSLAFADETILLSKEDTTYSGTKAFALTGDEIFPTIIIEEDGVQRITQDNGLRLYGLVDELIPRLYVNMLSSGSVISYTSDSVKYQQNGKFFIDGDLQDFASVRYVTYIDAEKINEVEIDLNEYNMGEYICPVDETFELTNGQIFATYVVAIDKFGLIHQYPLEYYVAGTDEYISSSYDIVRIFAPNGDIIYDTTAMYREEYLAAYGTELEIISP